MKVELRSVPGCPNVEAARQTVRAVLAELGLAQEISEVVGDYPSPTVLVDGVDVMGGSGDGSASCRLDPPTADRVRAALRQAIGPSTGQP